MMMLIMIMMFFAVDNDDNDNDDVVDDDDAISIERNYFCLFQRELFSHYIIVLHSVHVNGMYYI